VLDVRPDSEYASYHVPTAERVALPDVATLAPRAGETLVLYSGGGAHAAPAWVLLRAAGHERVYFLRGGLLEWVEDVMNPALGRDSTRAGGAADAELAALSRYFGGVPRRGAPGMVPWGAERPRATTQASAQATRRRGC
jgi:rhodanese-related sulfurtransferase